jgi:predicted Rossmann-fold nucleotide-binding protein
MAKALVIFPGGFGTLDEMFELLTLVQTQKLAAKIDVILYGTEYWSQILNMKPMVEWGAISPRDLDALHPADTPAEAFERLRDHLTKHHLEPDRPKSPGLAITRG